MRVLFPALLALTACSERVEVFVNTDGEGAVFHWDGEDMADLVVEAQDQDLTGEVDGTMMWSIACKPLENGTVPNCLRSPIAYGLLPMGTEQHLRPLPLVEGLSYWVNTNNYGADSESVEITGNGLFALTP